MTQPSIPKFLQLKREMLKRIRSATPGDCVESEHDLVARYGVSRATVAKAIGELVAEGYLYREQGRGTFVASSTRTPDGPLGVLFCGPNARIRPGDYFGDIFAGIDEVARRAGRDVLSMSGKTAPGEEFQPPSPMELARRGLAGVILVGVDSDDHLADILSAGLPAVSVDYHTDRVEIDSVVGDAEAGGYLGTKWLLGRGHRRVAFLGHARHGSRAYLAPDQGSLERLAGYRRAHREAKLAVDEELVFQPRQSEVVLGGRLDKLAAAARLPAAAFSTGTGLLDELLTWIAKHGERLEWVSAGWPPPRQLGDSAGGAVCEDPVEMGRAAARLAIERISGGGGAARSVVVPSQFLEPAVGGAADATMKAASGK
jgi:DNA-binding LacI/PurR family transcriptional regulator